MSLDKTILMIGMDNSANAIESALANIIIDYEKGLYIKGQDKSVINSKDYYYRIDRLNPGQLVEVQVKCFDDIKGNVFSKNGDIIISDCLSKNKHKFIFNHPTVPVLGRLIIASYIRDILDFVQIYKHPKNKTPVINNNSLKEVFLKVTKPDFHNTVNFKQFEEIVIENTSDIKQDIIDFVGFKTWDILMPDYLGDTARIINTGDFRIYMWTQEHGTEYSTK